jgi:hypothetical protein
VALGILMQSMAVLLPDFTTDGLPVEKSSCLMLHRAAQIQ